MNMNESANDRHKPLIGVIGDGSLAPGDEKRPLARSIGERLVDYGYRIACGGRSGVMEQVCRGAHDSERYREGDTVGILPGGDVADANAWVDIVLPTSLGHVRNSIVAQSAAVVAIGGGAGTLSEMCYAWIHDRLIIALRVDGWSGRMAAETLDSRRRFPDIDDDQIWAADDAGDVVSLLESQLSRYRRG
jgi:hypothetical protein